MNEKYKFIFRKEKYIDLYETNLILNEKFNTVSLKYADTVRKVEEHYQMGKVEISGKQTFFP